MLDILVIMDRSGSMSGRRADHEGGLQSFVNDQRDREGEIRFTLVQFDDVNPCEIVYDRARLEDVTSIQLIPRGGTPLLDAMGKAIAHLMKYQPTEVICMVVTDGQENASTEWKRDDIKKRVTELEALGWTFLFLGANIDAFDEARQVGIAGAFAANVANNQGGTQAAYASVASNLRGYRASRAGGMSVNSAKAQSMSFTDDQRASMTDDKDANTVKSTTTNNKTTE